ncbi:MULTISPECIES: D-2-hydroxyacid dehydrogenase [Streptomyces]|uniref:Putative 2-hydroxyacid dehydrogenase n=1 Tax=Streptomyces chartreusis NRRL 3882 TaxID=1079985 RepID=A0A2N9B139_STRCX|nr:MULTISPECIES: D-2-hydroxyacid dehydrogenase [Streptomyces]MYS90746.1 D-2-hydroxyacid dehydrogenase [Streptomyces sp. SID5464]SOR77054.1 putative 2-hydroxyacid dehydrogenase [Streptomyces chartreusis NRRL 3882]
MPDRLVVLYRGNRPPATGLIERLADTVYATEEELPYLLPGADALLAWVTITPAVREAWPDNPEKAPRWVHASSAGVDSFLFPALVDDPGVVLTNARGVYDEPTAEYVLGLILALAKDFPGTWEHQRRREWRPRLSDGITGRTVLVWGTGPIGRAIARLLGAVGMRVCGAGRKARTDDPDFGTVHGSTTLTAALGKADYVVLAAPLTKGTRGMVDASVLAAMKPGARLINVGRGGLVDEEALIDHLAAGRLAGAALDVFGQEPLPVESPLWDMPGVMISPHTAGETTSEREALVEVFLDNLTRHIEGRPLRNVVDKRRGYVVDETPPV